MNEVGVQKWSIGNRLLNTFLSMAIQETNSNPPQTKKIKKERKKEVQWAH